MRWRGKSSREICRGTRKGLREGAIDGEPEKEQEREPVDVAIEGAEGAAGKGQVYRPEGAASEVARERGRGAGGAAGSREE